MTSTTFPDSTSELRTYDTNGKPLKTIDRNGSASLLAYEGLGRLNMLTYCGTSISSDSYTYDKDTNVLQLQNRNATITYTYDARSRVLSEKYDANLASRLVCDLGCSGNGSSTITVTGGTSKTYILIAQ